MYSQQYFTSEDSVCFSRGSSDTRRSYHLVKRPLDLSLVLLASPVVIPLILILALLIAPLLLASLAGAAVESLPFTDVDNLLVPAAVGAVLVACKCC